MRNLDISQLEKGERIVDMCHNVRLARSSVCTLHDNVDRIKVSAQSGTKVFVCITRLPQSYWNELYQQIWVGVLWIFIVLEVNK
jgi:hypothetical protein